MDSRFKNYFLMNENDVPEYVNYILPDFFDSDAQLTSKEVGDGNLNYVFRVKDEKSKKTIIVKQAGAQLRISKAMTLSTDRGRREARILEIEGELSPGLVPQVYRYDETMCAILMEDMTGHEMMRPFLMNYKTYIGFAEDISTFLVNTLINTSDICLEHKKKKELVKDFVSPELCEITEELVYQEPYNDCKGRNNVFGPNKEFVKNELYEDKELILEVAKLKYEFMNNAQSLLHGDLHTGSIFINDQHIYVFDPEFAFYGPMGYDIGNIIANMFFAWCYADATLDTKDERREKFCTWVLDSIRDIIDLFREKYYKLYDEKVSDLMAKTPDFREWYLDGILSDTAGVAGLESNRRMVGMANVIDITRIPDQMKRAKAERMIITLAKRYIKERNSFKTGDDYLRAINAVTEQYSRWEG